LVYAASAAKTEGVGFVDCADGSRRSSDDRTGWGCYADYLTWQAAEGPAGKNAAYISLSSGWALGSDEFKQALVRDYKLAADVRAWELEDAKEVREWRWHEALKRACDSLPAETRRSNLKSAPWKVAVAAHLKKNTDASNGWLATQLEMGSPFYVSKYVGILRRSGCNIETSRLIRLLEGKGKA
jgi:putative transposase